MTLSGEVVDKEHRLPVRVYYEDTDFTGVVYHGAYVRFFERGRSDYLRCIGINHAELMGAEATAFSVIRMTVEFRRAARIDDALLVRTRFARSTGARLYFNQRIIRDDELIATAEVEAVCIDPSGRARRPPKALVDLVTPYLTGETP
jgi:acyl-CoA thioester hydrolase